MQLGLGGLLETASVCLRKSRLSPGTQRWGLGSVGRRDDLKRALCKETQQGRTPVEPHP